MINEVLDLAKVESGKMECRSECVDLAELTGEVRDVLRGLMAGKRLQLDVVVHPEVAPTIIDPGRVKQIPYNYLSNAIKFTADGGFINVRILPEGLPSFRIGVMDTRVGIFPEYLKRLLSHGR
jgi:signal transduction histidine kinase